MKKPLIYISGPISGYEHLNRPEFDNMAHQLAELGFKSSNPHDFCLGINASDPSDPAYYKRGMIELTECTDIILLSGWQYSKGAQLERQAAVLFGFGIFESVEDLTRKYAKQ